MFILNLTSNRDVRHYQIKENFVISQMKCDASSKLPRIFFSNCLMRHRPGAYNSLPFQVIIDIL